MIYSVTILRDGEDGFDRVSVTLETQDFGPPVIILARNQETGERVELTPMETVVARGARVRQGTTEVKPAY